MDWMRIFEEAKKEPTSPKCADEIEREWNRVNEERAIVSLRDYISQFAPSQEELDILLSSFVECEKFYSDNKEKRLHHFGYPANLLKRSPLYDYFAAKENTGYLANNCGDTFERSNYSMDSKEVEQSILKMFAKKFGIDNLPYWGYISSGGSESNGWGIENGFRLYPNGILYFCESAHYSVSKYAVGKRFIKIPQKSPTDESISEDLLFNIIDANPEPVILLLTWGSTKFGSCDNILKITSHLKKAGREYYVHVDAALYGGIPNNQDDAPVINDIVKLGINSISVSLHKYFGFPWVKSVVLSVEKPCAEIVPYIGISDSTTSGSRDIPPFTMKQQVFDVLYHSPKNEYRKNIERFQCLLDERGIKYNREKYGNIFVIDKPSDRVCKKYQLSTFDIKGHSGELVNKAHIIIFPYQDERILEELANELSEI